MAKLTELMDRIHRMQGQLNELAGRLRRMPQVLNVQENNIAKLDKTLSGVLYEQKQLVLESKNKEKEMIASEQSLERRRVQLGEAKTNKEFLALKQQIAADEAANSVLADEAFNALEMSEAYQENVAKAQADLKKAEELHESTKKLFEQEEPLIKNDIANLNIQLKEAERELPADFKEPYERLVRALGGSEALAIVRNGKFCAGCNQQIAINLLAQVIQKKPVTCASCGRLLYVSDDIVFEKS